MPWSYDPTRPEADRWHWWDYPDRAADPVRVVWPDPPRHELRVPAPAGEAVRIGAQVIAGIHAIVTDALADLAALEQHDPGGDRRW